MSAAPSETVIREVAPGVVIFSRPFARFGVWPVGGRSTAIKLRSGGVWVLASTPLDAETKAKLQEMGPVKYIVSADAVHHLYLGDFKKEYPEAKLIAPEAAIIRHDDKDLKFDGVWGRDPIDAKYGFEDDIEHLYFPGFENKDVAFLHKPSKTLIEADLLFNLHSVKEQYSRTKQSPRFLGIGGLRFGPNSWIYPRLLWSQGTNKDEMKRDARTVSGWDFDRIIPCHGDVIETGGKKAWNTAYKLYLA
ncbi:hypothetical protein HYPSUDRAFT_132423 [Hypholoma sublateritium FD-334 SS-4]|uniref:Metallo-beta-lactamase domain-containing protein n=1 Tax=Hypholoma sublateritium (strain FD-334 SS-4) TaxID=945553 RepID=A0A0D2PE16_HYPSF|nr:hypothetical protein HYPSUDRAFT_132423 [Hypholoma sublateritium FD-334 SS-4]